MRVVPILVLLATGACSLVVEGALVDLGPDCTGVENGESCPDLVDAGEMICLNGDCVESRCGDGFVDPRTEDCEGETLSCHLCRWRCVDDVDCDDGNVCNGAEQCLPNHQCVPGSLAFPGTPCTREGRQGTCDEDGVCEVSEP